MLSSRASRWKTVGPRRFPKMRETEIWGASSTALILRRAPESKAGWCHTPGEAGKVRSRTRGIGIWGITIWGILKAPLRGRREKDPMVGTGRFELPTPRTPSECSTRLSHVPTTEVFFSVHGF